MYLKSLTLKGFKSFADRTVMSFDSGLNVVVGPNGSGKSNISDAILWVLGEQSAKMLRGQAMEDVIFSGSSGRSAVALAEVTLTLDNADHIIPIDFAEIAITRRMYRSGESEYLINGSPSRLRDITDILHDSGLGKDTHSIISQGKLDSILASRPEERRELIEEAAGISKHRRRKERSERKLKAMHDNLLRAKDIEREIHRQLRPLERQVDKAKRQRAVSDELDRLARILAVDDLRRLQEHYGVLEERAREADAAIELAQFRLDERTADLNRYQALLEEKGIFVGDLGEQRRRLSDQLGRMDSDMRLLEEKGKNMLSRLSDLRMSLSNMERTRRATRQEHERVGTELEEAKGEDGELRRQVEELEPKVRAATERRRTLGGHLSRLTDEQRRLQRTADQETLAYAKLQDQISNAEVEDRMFESRLAQIEDGERTTREALEARAADRERLGRELEVARTSAERAHEGIRRLQGKLTGCRARQDAARESLARARATLSALKAMDEQAEGANRLAARLAKDSPELVSARVADLIDVPEGLDATVEALLGSDVGALVSPTAKGVHALVHAALSSHERGRATVVSQEVMGAAGSKGAGESLVGLLGAREGDDSLVSSLFAGVRLVGTVGEALAAHAREPQATYATRDGVVVWPDGRTSVGFASGVEQGMLERKRRIRRMTKGMAALEAALRAASEELARSERELSEARDAHAGAQGEVARLTGEVSSATSEVTRLRAQIDQAASERAQVEGSRVAAGERMAQARHDIAGRKAAADEAAHRAEALSDELERVSRERSEASREEGSLESKLSDAKLKLATVSERRSHLVRREEELARQLEQADRRIDEAVSSAGPLDVLRLRIDPLHRRYEGVRERALAWAARLKDRASLAEADSDSLKRTIGDARAAVDAASQELERARGQASEVKVAKGRLEVQVENAITKITDTGAILEEALGLPAPDDRDAMVRDVERLEAELADIGPVNEVAMSEYDRLRRRADFIGGQVEDLERARASLKRIITAIERKMRRRFVVVFDKVNANFSEIFSLLFPGGTARLELLDPDHLDETGIEIQAQPRGKRIQKMTLMSGGEKSLTALALLFAVYRTRTVPFYVFDEVEAALDDSNLSKLLDAIEELKKTTQLVVISHQRRTMEQADVLYGVSMQADGVSHVVSQRLDHATGRVVDA
ncbi:chromosome segregation protein SMC [Olsenella profusa]|uniref:Chromosome partition protein Smc n=1 Tax=Olsenella profusa F0195 TaxID=1125712 RepID=U2UZU0_9ACTN|nr:chromosome segregation protein SMC [Olsenella profusa]ERL08627.1 chromosome segregation protein SMC [Olsenella profusa F0195]